MAIKGSCHCGDVAFEIEGEIPNTRVVCVNARLVDDFDAASHPVEVIDGKNLW